MAHPLEAPEAVLDLLPVGVAVLEAPGRFLWCNPAFLTSSGRGPELLGRDVREIDEGSGSLGPKVREALHGAFSRGARSSFRSVLALHRELPGGVYLDVDVIPLAPRDGGPARALLVLREETERVREQRRAQLFYASFLSSSNAIELTDPEGLLVDVNPAFERIYGYSRAECVGRKASLVRSPNTPAELYRRMWADLLDPARGFWSGELQNRDRRGQDRPVFLSITAIRSSDGVTTHYLGVAIDLLEQKSWERVAGHAERLASLGQLAAGVAHEINTPLANVMLVTESLRRRTTDPVVTSRLETISGQVEIAAKIVRGLLDFARRSEPHLARLDLRDVTRDALEFLQGKQSDDVELDPHYAAEPVPVWGDRNQLLQVMTNLLNNAYDAMGGKGRIRLEVRRHGEDGEVEVSDSGPGISAEALPHIFEPFFTTKPEGQGTGLGLAICHGIVQTHHGSIQARNGPDGGASFLVTLPLAPGKAGSGPG